MSLQKPQNRFRFHVAVLTAVFALPLSLAMLERVGGIGHTEHGVRLEMQGAECLGRADALLRHLELASRAGGIEREASVLDARRCAPKSRAWAAIRSQMREHPDDARGRVLAGAMAGVLASIGDTSRLTYDWDPVVHQLARALSYSLPKVQVRLWNAALPHTRVATAKLQATGMAQLAVADGELTAAIDDDDAALGPVLGGPRLRLLASATAYSNALDAYENGPSDLRSQSAATLLARQRAVADTDAVYAVVRETLTRSLAQTIEDMQRRARLLWTAFAGSLLAAFGLAWLIARNVELRERRIRRELEHETWRLQAEIARDLAELELAARDARFQAIFAGSPLAIAIVDASGTVVECNEAYLQLVGSASADRRRRTLLDTLRVDPPDALGEMLSHVRAASMHTHQVDVLVGGRGDKRRWFHAVTSGVRNGSDAPVHFTVMLQDITDRKDRERAYLHEATHDSLTGLPNRAFVITALEQRLERDARTPRFAVLFLDVNDFKSINDTLGHRAGDDCLQNVAARLASLVREGDVVARFGGDEFVILLCDAHSIAQARDVAARITTAFRTPLVTGDVAVTLSLSAGLLVDRSEFDSAERVLREADRAMYDEKFGGPKRLATIHELKRSSPSRS